MLNHIEPITMSSHATGSYPLSLGSHLTLRRKKQILCEVKEAQSNDLLHRGHRLFSSRFLLLALSLGSIMWGSFYSILKGPTCCIGSSFFLLASRSLGGPAAMGPLSAYSQMALACSGYVVGS